MLMHVILRRMKMKKPSRFRKFKFGDFPDECYLKTCLGSKVLIIGYNNCVDFVSIWLDNETFVGAYYKGNLQASEDEVRKAWDLLCDKTGGEKLIGAWARHYNPNLIGALQSVIGEAESTTIHPTQSPPQPSIGCSCNSCRDVREEMRRERELQVQEIPEWAVGNEQPEQDRPMTYHERMQILTDFYANNRPSYQDWRTRNEHN